jgi:PhnB protein
LICRASLEFVKTLSEIGEKTDKSKNCYGEEIFNVLAEGGIVTMPLNKTFWGAYFGMLVDPFGINWMINVDLH